ncbi:hypothetical protein BY996DRAFT_6409127 [Phakopsora pachyrhizi]|nr:hypothetical protein BY996DRAFT_6409127 [Phakopsora pachyrhizi]
MSYNNNNNNNNQTSQYYHQSSHSQQNHNSHLSQSPVSEQSSDNNNTNIHLTDPSINHNLSYHPTNNSPSFYNNSPLSSDLPFGFERAPTPGLKSSPPQYSPDLPLRSESYRNSSNRPIIVSNYGPRPPRNEIAAVAQVKNQPVSEIRSRARSSSTSDCAEGKLEYQHHLSSKSHRSEGVKGGSKNSGKRNNTSDHRLRDDDNRATTSLQQASTRPRLKAQISDQPPSNAHDRANGKPPTNPSAQPQAHHKQRINQIDDTPIKKKQKRQRLEAMSHNKSHIDQPVLSRPKTKKKITVSQGLVPTRTSDDTQPTVTNEVDDSNELVDGSELGHQSINEQKVSLPAASEQSQLSELALQKRKRKKKNKDKSSISLRIDDDEPTEATRQNVRQHQQPTKRTPPISEAPSKRYRQMEGEETVEKTLEEGAKSEKVVKHAFQSPLLPPAQPVATDPIKALASSSVKKGQNIEDVSVGSSKGSTAATVATTATAAATQKRPTSLKNPLNSNSRGLIKKPIKPLIKKAANNEGGGTGPATRKGEYDLNDPMLWDALFGSGDRKAVPKAVKPGNLPQRSNTYIGTPNERLVARAKQRAEEKRIMEQYSRTGFDLLRQNLDMMEFEIEYKNHVRLMVDRPLGKGFTISYTPDEDEFDQSYPTPRILQCPLPPPPQPPIPPPPPPPPPPSYGTALADASGKAYIPDANILVRPTGYKKYLQPPPPSAVTSSATNSNNNNQQSQSQNSGGNLSSNSGQTNSQQPDLKPIRKD